MKFYFLDTSALVKRYHSEKGTGTRFFLKMIEQ